MKSHIQKLFSISEDVNIQLQHLCKKCPMGSDIIIVTERIPTFKTFYDLQDDNSFVILEHIDKELSGCVGSVHRKTKYKGIVYNVAYWGDLKVAPEYRKGLSAYRLMKELVHSEVLYGTKIAVASIIDGNKDSQVFTQGRAGLPKGHLMGRFILYNILPLFRLKTDHEFDISEARKTDIPELVNLYNQHFQNYQFAPYLTQSDFVTMVETFPGLSIDNFLVARKKGKIEAMLACWNQHEIQKFIIKKYNSSVQFTLLLIRFLSPFIKMSQIPVKNKELNFVYICFLAYNNSAALRTLIRTVHNRIRDDGYTYFSVCLNQNDKMTKSLKGMIYSSIKSSLYAYLLNDDFNVIASNKSVHMEYSMLI